MIRNISFLLTVIFLFSISFTQAEEDKLPIIDQFPKVKKSFKANYTSKDLKGKAQAVVSLEVVIDTLGKVSEVSILKGHSSKLDSAAIKALFQFQFTPALSQGKPVAVAIEYNYRFSITSKVNEFVNFKGTVLEKGSRKPIPDALVIVSFLDRVNAISDIPLKQYLKQIGSFSGQKLEEGSILTRTNDKGEFVFKSLPPINIKVSFPVSGFRDASFFELLKPKELTTNLYRLYKESYDDYEVTVYGKAERKQVAKSVLSVSEIKRIPGFGGDAIKVVQALPSVARPSFLSGQVIVRGSSNQDTRYFFNGISIPRLFHFGGIRSTIHSSLVSSLELYPGGFNSVYGGAVGGIIELVGREAKTDRWHGELDVSVIDANFLLEGPINSQHSLTVSGRYSYLGKAIELAVDFFDTEGTTVSPIYQDALVRWDYAINSKNKLFLQYNSSKDDLKIIIPTNNLDTTEQDNSIGNDELYHAFQLGVDNLLTKKLKLKTRLGATKFEREFKIFDFLRFHFDDWQFSFRSELEHLLSSQWKFLYGVDVDAIFSKYVVTAPSSDNNFDNGVVETRTSNNTQAYSTLAPYWVVEYQPFKNWLIIPSTRLDYFSEVDQWHWSYRLTSRYTYQEGYTVKGAVGSYSQGPKPLGQSTDKEFGNPNLPITTAEHYVLGHEIQFSDLLFLDVQTYYNLQHNIPRSTDSILPSGSRLNFVGDMEGRSYGIELLLKHDQGKHFFGWIGYSLSRSERRAPGPTEQGFLSGGEEVGQDAEPWDPDKWVTYNLDQTHNLQVIGNWRFPANFETGFRFRYTSGNPITPRLSLTKNEFIFDSDQFQYLTNEGVFNSDRQDPFIQLDIRVDKKFIFDTWILALYLDLQNVLYFWYSSPEQIQYNFDGSEKQNIGVPLIPSFGVNVKF